jgi:hypothetical protein
MGCRNYLVLPPLGCGPRPWVVPMCLPPMLDYWPKLLSPGQFKPGPQLGLGAFWVTDYICSLVSVASMEP